MVCYRPVGAKAGRRETIASRIPCCSMLIKLTREGKWLQVSGVRYLIYGAPGISDSHNPASIPPHISPRPWGGDKSASLSRLRSSYDSG